MTPIKAYDYALKYGPSKETRKIVCEEPELAFWYASWVDQCPGEDTRNAASYKSSFAYYYAKDVEKGFHEVTWNAVKNTEWEQEYIEFLNSLDREKII